MQRITYVVDYLFIPARLISNWELPNTKSDQKKRKKRDQQIKKRLIRNEQADISTKMSKRSKFEVQHSTDLTMRWKGQI